MIMMTYIIAYKESMCRDTQVFLGDPVQCDPLSDQWVDAPGAEVLAGIYRAADEETALKMAARLEGCHETALHIVAKF